MYPDTSAGLAHPSTDLERLDADGIYLGGFQFGAPQVTAQEPEKTIRGSVQQEPELISQEAMAAQAIGLDLQLQFLNPVFDVTSEDIDIVIDHLSCGAG
jgi:hypothetical protein